MKIKSRKLFKIIALFICFSLLFEQSGFAQVAGQLDISGQIMAFSNSLRQDKFRPLHLRYLQYDPQLNNFKLLLDKGSLKTLSNSFVEQSTKTLLQYFLIGISLPNSAFWVNLRPDDENNMIDPLLAQTEIGKILLEADVQLKKDTASFTSPQTAEGKEYWDKLYRRAEEIYGSQNITIPTLTRPWIVPNEIIVRQANDNAYIYKATLKVMLEQDYLKDSVVYNFSDPRQKELNDYSTQLLREKIIPKLTQEINTAKRYASLRQVYYSLILAQWFKQKFAGGNGVYAQLIDRKNLNGITSKEPWSKTTYFNQYQKSFQQGEYNFKVPVSTVYGQTIRSYFSGGCSLGNLAPSIAVNPGSSSNGEQVILALKSNLPVAVQGGTVGQELVHAMAQETEKTPVNQDETNQLKQVSDSAPAAEQVQILPTVGGAISTTANSQHKRADFGIARMMSFSFLSSIVVGSILMFSSPLTGSLFIGVGLSGFILQWGYAKRHKFLAILILISTLSGPPAVTTMNRLNGFSYDANKIQTAAVAEEPWVRKVDYQQTEVGFDTFLVFVKKVAQQTKNAEAKNRGPEAILELLNSWPLLDFDKLNEQQKHIICSELLSVIADEEFRNTYSLKVLEKHYDLAYKVQMIIDYIGDKTEKNAAKKIFYKWINSYDTFSSEEDKMARKYFPNIDPREALKCSFGWHIGTIINFHPSIEEAHQMQIFERFLEVFGSITDFERDVKELDELENATIHEIPVEFLPTIQEIRRLPPQLKKYIKESAKRYNIPEVFLVYSFIMGGVFDRDYPIERGLKILAKRSGVGWEQAVNWMPRSFHSMSIGSRTSSFLGAIAGGKATIGPTRMRPAWVRRSPGVWHAFGVDAQELAVLSDREISWLMLDPAYSIDATAAYWRTGIDWVSRSRELALSGERFLKRGDFSREASERFEFAENSQSAAYLPDSAALHGYGLILELAYHPQAEWWTGHGMGVYDGRVSQNKQTLQHYLRPLHLMRCIILSGVLDDKPSTIKENNQPKAEKQAESNLPSQAFSPAAPVPRSYTGAGTNKVHLALLEVANLMSEGQIEEADRLAREVITMLEKYKNTGNPEALDALPEKFGYVDLFKDEIDSKLNEARNLLVQIEAKKKEGLSTAAPAKTSAVGNVNLFLTRELAYQAVSGTKVTDEHGRVAEVYHGGSAEVAKVGFDLSLAGTANDHGDFGEGVYWISSLDVAKRYARLVNVPGKGGTGKVYSAFLNIRNPFRAGENLPEYIKAEAWEKARISREKDGEDAKDMGFYYGKAITQVLKARGYDGVIAERNGETEYVVFDLQQIIMLNSIVVEVSPPAAAPSLRPEDIQHARLQQITRQSDPKLDYYSTLMDYRQQDPRRQEPFKILVDALTRQENKGQLALWGNSVHGLSSKGVWVQISGIYNTEEEFTVRFFHNSIPETSVKSRGIYGGFPNAANGARVIEAGEDGKLAVGLRDIQIVARNDVSMDDLVVALKEKGFEVVFELEQGAVMRYQGQEISIITQRYLNDELKGVASAAAPDVDTLRNLVAQAGLENWNEIAGFILVRIPAVAVYTQLRELLQKIAEDRLEFKFIGKPKEEIEKFIRQQHLPSAQAEILAVAMGIKWGQGIGEDKNGPLAVESKDRGEGNVLARELILSTECSAGSAREFIDTYGTAFTKLVISVIKDGGGIGSDILFIRRPREISDNEKKAIARLVELASQNKFISEAYRKVKEDYFGDFGWEFINIKNNSAEEAYKAKEAFLYTLGALRYLFPEQVSEKSFRRSVVEVILEAGLSEKENSDTNLQLGTAVVNARNPFALIFTVAHEWGHRLFGEEITSQEYGGVSEIIPELCALAILERLGVSSEQVKEVLRFRGYANGTRTAGYPGIKLFRDELLPARLAPSSLLQRLTGKGNKDASCADLFVSALGVVKENSSISYRDFIDRLKGMPRLAGFTAAPAVTLPSETEQVFQVLRNILSRGSGRYKPNVGLARSLGLSEINKDWEELGNGVSDQELQESYLEAELVALGMQKARQNNAVWGVIFSPLASDNKGNSLATIIISLPTNLGVGIAEEIKRKDKRFCGMMLSAQVNQQEKELLQQFFQGGISSSRKIIDQFVSIFAASGQRNFSSIGEWFLRSPQSGKIDFSAPFCLEWARGLPRRDFRDNQLVPELRKAIEQAPVSASVVEQPTAAAPSEPGPGLIGMGAAKADEDVFGKHKGAKVGEIIDENGKRYKVVDVEEDGTPVAREIASFVAKSAKREPMDVNIAMANIARFVKGEISLMGEEKCEAVLMVLHEDMHSHVRPSAVWLLWGMMDDPSTLAQLRKVAARLEEQGEAGISATLESNLKDLKETKLKSAAGTKTEKAGGINLTALPIVTQGIKNWGTVPFGDSPPGNQRVIFASLEKELRGIEQTLNGGIIPSNERIKEYLLNVCAKGDCAPEFDKILSCIADILRLEEERGDSTAVALREMLVLLELNKPAQEMQLALAMVNVDQKEPMIIE